MALEKWNNKNYHLNTKLNQEEIDFLIKYFEKDILNEKQRILGEEELFFSNAMEGIILNLNFTFYDKEKKNFRLIFEEHKRLLKVINDIKTKLPPFNDLTKLDKELLLKSSFKTLEYIQQEIKKNRKQSQNLIKEKTFTKYLVLPDPSINLSFPDGDNPFNSSLGDGEEAHIASWNID